MIPALEMLSGIAASSGWSTTFCVWWAAGPSSAACGTFLPCLERWDSTRGISTKRSFVFLFFVVLFLYIESTLFKIHILVMDFFYLDLLHFILTSHPQNLTSRTCSHNNRICVSAVEPLYCFVALFTNSYNENNTKLLMVYIFKALYFFRQGQQNTWGE